MNFQNIQAWAYSYYRLLMPVSISFFTVVFLPAAISSGAQQDGAGAKNLYFIGGNASLSIRKGAYEFDDFELRQDTARNTIPLFGFSFGRRYGLSEMLRLTVGMTFNFGSVFEDTLEPQPGSAYLVKNSLFQMDLEPELQLALSEMQGMRPFIFAGGGISFVRFREGFFLPDDPGQQIEFTVDSDMEPMLEKRWCPHAHGGVGFDLMRRREIGLCVRYQFRFWIPVRYDEQRDLPLQGIEYREIFLTHMLQLQLLLAFEE